VYRYFLDYSAVATWQHIYLFLVYLKLFSLFISYIAWNCRTTVNNVTKVELSTPKNHLQPEDTPCLVTRDPLNMVLIPMYSQLPSISGGRPYHPHPEDAPCHGEKARTSYKITLETRKYNIKICYTLPIMWSRPVFDTTLLQLTLLRSSCDCTCGFVIILQPSSEVCSRASCGNVTYTKPTSDNGQVKSNISIIYQTFRESLKCDLDKYVLKVQDVRFSRRWNFM
jgi:hypothetical protein